MLRRSFWLIALLLVLGAAYLLTTDNDRIWPLRNIAHYAVLTGSLPTGDGVTEAGTDVETASAAEANFTPRPPSALSLPADMPRGELRGVVRTPTGNPIQGARVLVSARDGTAFSAETGVDGRYAIEDVPVGSYVPVAGAPGFEDRVVRTVFGTGVREGESTPLDVTLTPRELVEVSPGQDFELSEPQVWQVTKPIQARAVRRVVSFEVDGRSNQTTLYYTPDDGQTTPLPTLLAVYPGPADTWESVSLPLAQAGYAVIAVGPEYALDLEQDIDDLQRVVDLVEAGRFPRADGNRIGALGGSYSGLHVLRLAIRNPDALDAALLLGPPTDAFELRRQYEAGTFLPPFGLDQALVALGLPDRVPERYWRYSARYHAAAIDMPLMLIHSKADNVVPFTQSQLLADELERLGKPHELRIIEGMGHYLLATEPSPAIDELFQTTIGFFNEQLR